jgi:hypothetical protein
MQDLSFVTFINAVVGDLQSLECSRHIFKGTNVTKTFQFNTRPNDTHKTATAKSFDEL